MIKKEYLNFKENENLNTSKNSTEPNVRKVHKFVQKEMRFKPRTDLERIFDAINDYSYGKINKEILDKQLKNLDLKDPEITEKSEPNIMPLSSDEKNNSAAELTTSKLNTLRRIKRKLVDNSEAKNLLKDYHNKTHFKAATDVALFNRKKNIK